jgi:transcriptional regulator with XRE-family HTH domain
MLREQMNMSQRELARASGLSPNTLSLIERGQTSPTASTLQKLAAALNISMTAFFESDSSGPRHAIYTREGHRPHMDFASGELVDLGPSGLADAPVAPLILILEPGASSGTLMTHSGQEFAYCLKGRIVYLVDDEVFLLEPGDSLLFDAQRLHRWKNPGMEPARMLVVLCPDRAGEHLVEKHLHAHAERR